jgi:NAD(P)-dependent dehydrogenase (short-subunit alcohol dehydrogenase family)
LRCVDSIFFNKTLLAENNMASHFSEKTVIVTGSGGGLGKAIATAYLNAGAQVVVCDINEARLKEAEAELTSKGTVFAHQVDITSEDSIATLAKAVIEKFGKIDVLVNNAGVSDMFGKLGFVLFRIYTKSP